MAGRISSCLNLPSNSTQSLCPLLDTKSQISWRKRRTEDETEPRKNKCSLVLGMTATVMIGAIQISDVASVEAAVVESPVKEVVVVPPRRWSDKRMCPPWLENSLETIVPENLPRPSAHRRLELAGLDKGGAPPVGAPPVGAAVTRVNRAACFSV